MVIIELDKLQNQGCFRENCRFVHAPSHDVEAYKATGDVSNTLARAIAAVSKNDNINGECLHLAIKL